MSEVCDGVRSQGTAGQYEWWYFDFPAGEQGAARIEWHAPLFNLLDRNCVLVLRYYDHQPFEPGQTARPVVLGARFPRSRVKMDTGRCRISFPTGSIREEEQGYRIRIIERRFEADLELIRQLPPVNHPDGAIIRPGNGAESLCWAIPLPRARAAGTLTLDGVSLPVNGPGYHDHNWGNLDLGRRLRRWIWLRVPFEHLTLIMARLDLCPGEEPAHQVILLDREGQRIDAPPMEVELTGERVSRCGRLRFPGTINIRTGQSPVCRIRIEVDHSHTVEEEPLGRFGNGWVNSLYARLWYLGGHRVLPRRIRERLGRLLYLQAPVTAQLAMDNSHQEEQQGVFEVFHCAS